MEKLILNSQKRDNSEVVSYLRNNRTLPWVVYGHKQKPISLKLDYSDFLRVFRISGENHIISLDIEWQKLDVLVHDYQKHPVKWDYTHVDFYAISAGEKVHTNIPIVLIGSAPASREWAVIEEHLKELEVKCMPNDLVDNFEVDLSSLKEVGDAIKVRDIIVDTNKITVLTPEDEVVVIASASRAQIETEEVPEAGDVPEIGKEEKNED